MSGGSARPARGRLRARGDQSQGGDPGRLPGGALRDRRLDRAGDLARGGGDDDRSSSPPARPRTSTLNPVESMQAMTSYIATTATGDIADRLGRLQIRLRGRHRALRDDAGDERDQHPPGPQVPRGLRVTTERRRGPAQPPRDRRRAGDDAGDAAQPAAPRRDPQRGLRRPAAARRHDRPGRPDRRSWSRPSPKAPRRSASTCITNPPSTAFPEKAGYRPAIVGSLKLIAGVILFVVPVGIGAALYLEEYADRSRWWNTLIEVNIQNLAAVPSIIYGILGLAFIVRGPLDLGFILAAGSLTLALLVLPMVIIAAREAMRAVPGLDPPGLAGAGRDPVADDPHARSCRPRSPASRPASSSPSRGRWERRRRCCWSAPPSSSPSTRPRSAPTATRRCRCRSSTTPLRPQEEFQALAAAGIIVMLVVLLAMNSFAIWLRNRYEQRW